MRRDEEPVQGLLGEVDWRRTPPETLLLEGCLAGLDKNQQIQQITTALLGAWGQDAKAIPLVGVLKHAFGDDQIGFRAHLRTEVYPKLPAETTGPGTHWVGDKSFPDVNQATAGLRAAILAEILEGWRWVSQKYSEPPCLEEDAEASFLFVCQAHKEFQKWHASRDKVPEVFRAYLEKHPWSAVRLDPWTTRKEVPDEICLVLLKARTRTGGVDVGVREVSFLEPFGLHQRSDSAISLAQEALKKIAQTDSLTTQLMQLINPPHWVTPRGEGLIPSFNEVSYSLVSEDLAIVTICFKRSRWSQENEFARMALAVQQAKDNLLASVEHPPKILIHAQGPDGIILKEE